MTRPRTFKTEAEWLAFESGQPPRPQYPISQFLFGLYLLAIPAGALALLVPYVPLVLAGLVVVWLNVSYARDPLTPEEINELSIW